MNCSGDWFRPSTFHNKPLNLFLSMFESLLMLLSGKLTLLIYSKTPNFLSSLPNIRLHDPVLLNQTITVLGLPTNEELETSFNLFLPSAVPSNVFPMLNKSKNVHLPFGRFPFHSRIHPTRCLNCQTYGNNISKCQNLRVCEHCGKDHSSDNCPKTSPSFCVPCFKSKRSCHDQVTTSFSCLLYRHKCDSRWDVRLGNDGQPLILKSTMYLCLLNSLFSILGLLVVNLLLYSILSFLLNLTLLL